jgi:hypothetical protein
MHWVDLFSGLHLISWEEGAKGPKGKSKLVKVKILKNETLRCFT